MQRARRTWFETHYPALAERMLGAADVHGVDPSRDDLDLGMLGTYEVPAGCSVVFHPGSRCVNGHGLLGRNFDFPTVGYRPLVGMPKAPDERPLAADPWVVELHPDHGYASLTIGIMDVMGAMDGINSAGLAVSLLADDESPNGERSGSGQVGLSEQQVVRYLLDTCATVEQAQQALLVAKHYYLFVPCHFMVADASGRAFVWEHSPGRNLELIVEPDDSSDGHLVCTNHLLHRPASLWPAQDGREPGIAGHTQDRWLTLARRARDEHPVDAHVLRDQLADVAFSGPGQCVRTLWSAVYDLSARALEVSFYLHDEDGVSRYSRPFRLTLPSPQPRRVSA